MSDSWGIIVIAIGTVVGGFLGTVICTHVMDCISKPIERRRKVELAASRATSIKLRELVLEKLFPERLYNVNDRTPTTTKKSNPADEETGGESQQPCAICIEGFYRGDSVIEGGQGCHHMCHRHCLMTWLQNHNDCPVCRDNMWTRDTFIEAKKQVFLDDPDVLDKEWTAIVAQLRQGVMLDTNQEPDDIVIETLNTPSPEEAVPEEVEMTQVTATTSDTVVDPEAVENAVLNENAYEEVGTTEDTTSVVSSSRNVDTNKDTVIDEEVGTTGNTVMIAKIGMDDAKNTVDMDGEEVDT